MKDVNNQNLWTLELGCQEGVNGHIKNIVGFQQRNQLDSATAKNANVYSLVVTSAQRIIRIIGTEKHPDVGIIFNYNDEDYSQGYC